MTTPLKDLKDRIDIARDGLHQILDTTTDPATKELAASLLSSIGTKGLATERYFPTERRAYDVRHAFLMTESQKIVRKGEPQPSYAYLGEAKSLIDVYRVVRDSGHATQKPLIERMSQRFDGDARHLIILENISLDADTPSTFTVFYVTY